MELGLNRRRFVQLSGAAVVGAGGFVAGTSVDSASAWTKADSPTAKKLHGVCESRTGPFAVGGDGLLIHRQQSGNWEVVLQEGPTDSGQNLRTIDRTDGGQRVWFAGASGVIAEYDVVSDTLYDHSSPGDITDTWEGISVRGRAGQREHVYLVNGSGAQLTGVRTAGGDINWRGLKKPGSGSSLKSIDFHAKESGHTCDTNQSVFHTTSSGGAWEKIGIEDQDENFYEVQSVARDDVNVCGGGKVYWYDGTSWHEFDVADHTLRGLDRDASFGLAADTAGFTYEREGVGVWREMDTPTDEPLHGIARSTRFPDVAVGRNGVIVERPT